MNATGVDAIEPAVLCDVTIQSGRISAVSATGGTPPDGGAITADLDGALVWPGLIDAHVHLDKAHTWERAPNRSATFLDALTTLGRDKDNWTAADLERRAEFSLRCAYAHGTRLIRTHVDTGLPRAETSHAVIAALRARWADRVELQTVPLCGIADFSTAAGEIIADLALRHGAVALGGFAVMSPELPAYFDRLLALARERGVGLDLHVDENGIPASECFAAHRGSSVAKRISFSRGVRPLLQSRRAAAGATARDARSRQGRGHPRDFAATVQPLPAGPPFGRRISTASSWRGLRLIQDMLDAGIPVACASDNVRDAFFAYGDFDALEVYAQSVRLAHLDTRIADSVRVVTSAAAEIVGRPELGRIAPGAPAASADYQRPLFQRTPQPPRRAAPSGRRRSHPRSCGAGLRGAGMSAAAAHWRPTC